MKKSHYLQFVFLSVLILAFYSCTIEDSADVNQDKIYADYEVFYNSNSDKSIALAKFKFGGATGTILQLTDPAEVTFNGEKLPFKAIHGGHYKEFAGRISEGTFEYSNVDGTIYRNEIPEVSEIDFPSELDTLSKSSAYTFKWLGDPLTQNEHVGLFVGTWKWGQDALFFQNSLGASELIMGTDKLKNLAKGSSTLYMDRTTLLEIEEGTAEGGYIRAKFRAKNIEVEIVE